MEKHINIMLKPNSKILTIYGLLSLVFLTVFVWRLSFIWEFVFSVTHYVVGLLIALILGLVIARLLDKKLDWQLKRYFVVSIIQLLIIWTVSNPIRTWQIDSSLKEAQFIIEPLEAYKKQNGTYPTTLTEARQKLDKDIPIRTNIGTRYQYEIVNEQDYKLWFRSYYGSTANYNKELDKWVITD